MILFFTVWDKSCKMSEVHRETRPLMDDLELWRPKTWNLGVNSHSVTPVCKPTDQPIRTWDDAGYAVRLRRQPPPGSTLFLLLVSWGFSMDRSVGTTATASLPFFCIHKTFQLAATAVYCRYSWWLLVCLVTAWPVVTPSLWFPSCSQGKTCLGLIWRCFLMISCVWGLVVWMLYWSGFRKCKIWISCDFMRPVKVAFAAWKRECCCWVNNSALCFRAHAGWSLPEVNISTLQPNFSTVAFFLNSVLRSVNSLFSVAANPRL